MTINRHFKHTIDILLIHYCTEHHWVLFLFYLNKMAFEESRFYADGALGSSQFLNVILFN